MENCLNHLEKPDNPDSFKNYLIIFLGAACVILLILFIFNRGEDYSEEVKRLRNENAQLEFKNKEFEQRVDSLHDAFEKLEHIDDSLANKISSQEEEIAKLNRDSKRSAAELEKIRKEVAETMQKIKSMRKNPPNRKGEELLNSLKLKTTK